MSIDTTALIAFHNEVLTAKDDTGKPLYDLAYRMTSANFLHTLVEAEKKVANGK